MIDREQGSLRQAVAWLGDTVTVRGATRLVELAHSDVVAHPTRVTRLSSTTQWLASTSLTRVLDSYWVPLQG